MRHVGSSNQKERGIKNMGYRRHVQLTEMQVLEIARLAFEKGEKPDLRGRRMSAIGLYQAKLSGADLREADLTQTNLSGADLSQANLSKADLS